MKLNLVISSMLLSASLLPTLGMDSQKPSSSYINFNDQNQGKIEIVPYDPLCIAPDTLEVAHLLRKSIKEVANRYPTYDGAEKALDQYQSYLLPLFLNLKDRVSKVDLEKSLKAKHDLLKFMDRFIEDEAITPRTFFWAYFLYLHLLGSPSPNEREIVAHLPRGGTYNSDR